MPFIKSNLPLFILLILAFLTRFLFLAYPTQVVFDEVYFGKFVSAYFTHEYYFDIHPPLGKLLIAGFASLFNFQANFSFGHIGDIYNPYYLFILRFLPAFFSALFTVLIYKLCLALGLSRKASFLAGFLVLFDNAILGQSKFILVDIFLLFFGFASLLFFVLARKTEGKKLFAYYAVSALFAGLSLSVKWTGFSFLGIILTFLFFDFLHQLQIKKYLLRFAIFLVIPFLVYISIFVIHFNFLNKPGSGSAFMTPAFNNQSLSFAEKFLELNKAMFTYNAKITAVHPYASRWFEWPLAQKPIWYWTEKDGGPKADIYLAANPIVWWLAFASVIAAVILIFFKKIRKKLSPVIYLLLFGYFLNLLPFMLISRATFLYHYFASLIFGIIIFAFLCDKLLFAKEQKIIKAYKMKKTGIKEKTINIKNILAIGFFLLVLFSALVGFLIFSPLTYGFPTPLETQKFLNLFL